MPDSIQPKVRKPFELINDTDDTPRLGAEFTKAFKEFHSENPQVYELFKEYAFEAMAAGMRHLSSKLIIERIRWESMITTTDVPYTVSNNHTPDYARLFMLDFPEYKGFFTTFKRSIAA